MPDAHRFFRFFLTACFILACFPERDRVMAADAPALSVVTDGGAVLLSQDEAFFKPFTEASGTAITTSPKGDALEQLKQWRSTSQPGADVINLTSYEAEQACDQSLLHSFTEQDIALGANGEPIMRDFFADSLMDCAVPNVAWAALMVVKPQINKRKQARSWKDFFNVKGFPGKRSLKKSARFTLELALLSAGVRGGDVYSLLSTERGQKQAFSQLQKIKNQIVWWEDAKGSIAAFSADDVAMGMTTNGRLFHATVADGFNGVPVWAGHIYDFDYWGIPLSSKNQAQALAFVKFATSPERLAAQTGWMPYGPMRASSQGYIKTHKIGGMGMKPYVPTAQRQFKGALKFNEGWWRSEAGVALDGKFKVWLEGRDPFGGEE